MLGPHLLSCLMALTCCQADTPVQEHAVEKDIPYATAGKEPLLLDLYRPQGKLQPVLLVWVHGGAWRGGSKSEMPLKSLVQAGYAVASVDYRLSTQAKFPAQVHDIKAALRFLRAKGTELRIGSKHIVITGASAGAHLANLVGVSNGHRELEGDIGDHDDQSAEVQGIISFYGMSNLTTILAQSTPHGLKVRVPALELLLGGQPDARPDLARLASPVFHVDKSDPPLLLFHGDQDPQAPINQSHELHGAYLKNKLPARLEVVYGAGHGGAAFYAPEQLQLVQEFLTTLPKH